MKRSRDTDVYYIAMGKQLNNDQPQRLFSCTYYDVDWSINKLFVMPVPLDVAASWVPDKVMVMKSLGVKLPPSKSKLLHVEPMGRIEDLPVVYPKGKRDDRSVA